MPTKPHQTSVWRRIFFAGVVTAIVLGATTVVLGVLERRGVIDTARLDDRVAAPLRNILSKEKTDRGLMYKIADEPFLVTTHFPVEKASDVVRVVVSGGSFMQGTPYTGPGGIPFWVEAELETRFPSRRIEIVNAAVGGQDSSRVRHLVEALVNAEADAVVVATGNNEGFVAPTIANEPLHRWVVYRMAKKWLLPEIPPSRRSIHMQQFGSPEEVAARFQGNIQAMVSAARTANVPLVLTTLPINLKYDTPLRVPEGAPDPDLAAGHAHREAGRFAQALDAYAKAAEKDAVFFLGLCHEGMGDFEAARRSFLRDAELNPLNRMRPSFNEILREAARADGVYLADGYQAVAAAAPHGIPDPELFFDYCHMHWRGYHAVAREIVRTLVEADLVRGQGDEPLEEPDVADIITRRRWQRQLDSPRRLAPASLKSPG